MSGGVFEPVSMDGSLGQHKPLRRMRTDLAFVQRIPQDPTLPIILGRPSAGKKGGPEPRGSLGEPWGIALRASTEAPRHRVLELSLLGSPRLGSR